MYRQRTTYWLCISMLLLAACDNSRSGFDSLQAGIEGSGRTITASGIMRATADGIVVNGVEYGLDGAAIAVNGVPAFRSELASGHLAVVQGEVDATGQRGSATQVDVEIALAGRIASLDFAEGRFTVLGQVVAVDESTIIENEVEGSELGGLTAGRDVEVSGFADSSGVLHATLVASRRAATPFIVTGRIASVDASVRVFSINGQAVGYEDAVLRGLIAPVEGVTVQVVARDLLRDVLVADTVRLRTPRLPGDVGDSAAIEGRVTRLSSPSDFEIDGRAVAQGSNAPTRDSDVLLDAFLSARGTLDEAGVVVATTITGLLPAGRVGGTVRIGADDYEVSGVLTPHLDFRLSIGAPTGGTLETEPSIAQLVGSFPQGPIGLGVGVLIGEDCAGPDPARFCGRRLPVEIEVSKNAGSAPGATGVVRVATDQGEETWELRLGYWGGRSGFDPVLAVAGTYEIGRTEMVGGAAVTLTVDGAGRVFFQNPLSTCVGDGTVGAPIANVNLRNVRLTITNCDAAFDYLNADYEGLALIESATPWDYDLSILRMWLSTAPDAPHAAAISLWSRAIGAP